MSKNYWYEKPTVLLNSWNIVPFSNNTNVNVNSLARLAIMLIIMINIFNISQKYNSIPIIILIFSFIIKPIEKFNRKKNMKNVDYLLKKILL